MLLNAREEHYWRNGRVNRTPSSDLRLLQTTYTDQLKIGSFRLRGESSFQDLRDDLTASRTCIVRKATEIPHAVIDGTEVHKRPPSMLLVQKPLLNKILQSLPYRRPRDMVLLHQLWL